MKNISYPLLLGAALVIGLNGCVANSVVSMASPRPALTPEMSTSTTAPEPELSTPTTTSIPEGKTIVVSSVEDSGTGTLRQAMQDAQAGDTITFDLAVFPPDHPSTIFLKGNDISLALPEITQGRLTIDASDAGVILDGSKTSGEWVNCISIRSDENTIRGLQIAHFPGSGIGIMGGSKNNMIGGDRNEGQGPLGQGNLSSGNYTGIDLQDESTSFNVISGNLVGTEISGMAAFGNQGTGVYLANGASQNTIGPGNIIAYNSEGIIVHKSNSTGNTITQNSVHHNVDFGISLGAGGNAGRTEPGIIGYDLQAGSVTVMTCPRCTVEVYSDETSQGEVFEVKGTADDLGFLALDTKTPFSKPHLTAIATDLEGTSSGFSPPTEGNYLLAPDVSGSALLQAENDNIKNKIIPKNSAELKDNRMGTFTGSLLLPAREPEVFPDMTLDSGHITGMGFKRFRFTINSIETPKIDWEKSEFSIDPAHDEFISALADAGVTLTYVLSFWDTDRVMQGGNLQTPRFRNEEEVQRYLEYVRFTVRHFKGRVDYFEIWNEPNHPNPDYTPQQINAPDYINLVKRIEPVIREEYPQAKIVVGGTTSLIDEDSQSYLFAILNSDIMPLVDAVSWHPMYGSSPEYDRHRQYYYGYPALVQKLKDTANSHGFAGEFIADEIHWPTPSQPEQGWPTYSNIQSVKYMARSVLIHLGMDMAVTQLMLVNNPQLVETNANLSTVMAGSRTIDLTVDLQSEADSVKTYGFSLPGGDQLVALWNDGSAVDFDSGIPSTVTIPGYAGWKATGIDVLNGFEQEIVTSMDNGDLVIRDFRLKDYPIMIRLSK
ncbi:MAG: hypothetical protein AB9891_07795 [Anaerolineaceae bacterium]